MRNLYKLNQLQQKHGSFVVTKAQEIPELQAFLRELVHEPTGASVMHIANQDPENLFCLSFRTYPASSNGVAHILEHTVLCGSEKYPIKDPFFSMNRRSLNTFMNALTGADFTCYPAASQVPKDFYHLLEVYLDAVFHPLLNQMSFLQEGHRLEFIDQKNLDSPLERKGIVFNEMKGALASPSARLAEAINHALFPEITYGVNSGGDPRNIPSLTYEELKEFYKKFYHISHCLFFFYGNLPLEPHLDFLEKHALAGQDRALPLSPLPLQPRFDSPRFHHPFYPAAEQGELEDKAMIAFGWLTCHILEQEEALALTVLQIILLDTDASCLKQALLQSLLCKQVSSFIDVEIQEIPWGIILKGCDATKVSAIKECIDRELIKVAEEGIALTQMENALHQLEFHRSEITGDHAPFGLSLFMRGGLLQQHGVQAELGFAIHALFDRLHHHILEDPFYFSRLIRKWLLENPHAVTIVLEPSHTLGQQEGEEEKLVLEKLREELSAKQKQQIIEQTEELATFQREQELQDVDVLPNLTFEDIPKKGKEYFLHQEELGGMTLFHHPVFTNGIVYADLVFDLPRISKEEIPLLRLLSVVANQVGTGERDYVATLDAMQAHTGGIGVGINLNLQAENSSEFCPTLHVRGKALERKTSKLFALLQDLVSSASFTDRRRLQEIVKKHWTQMEGRLSQSALRYAINLAASRFGEASWLANALYGLSYYEQVKDWVARWEEVEDSLCEGLSKLYKRVMRSSPGHLVIGCDQMAYGRLKGQRFHGLVDLGFRSDSLPWRADWGGEGVKNSFGRVIASPVAFIGQVVAGPSYTHREAPYLGLAAGILDHLVLHPKIREQGGAYGGGAVSNPMAGNFYFYSYRDPQIEKTLEVFREGVDLLVQGGFEEEDLHEAKFEFIQSLDAPISPGSRSEVAYSWLREGKSFSKRQAFREAVLQARCQDVQKAAQKWLLPGIDQAVSVVFAGKEMLDRANQQRLDLGKPEWEMVRC